MARIQSFLVSWRRLLPAALSLMWLPVAAGAQNILTDTTNGISVGCPKIFDNRSLSIMLDQLSAQLQSLQTINGTTVNGALSNQQGAESHTKSLAVSLAASGVPGAAAATDKANPQPPAPPGAATLPTAPTFSPTFGQSASDLLSDQVNLSYQIFNIRMLLERALSDRLYQHDTRLQAVVGFQVSLDPPKNTQDRAAFVEITVSPAVNPHVNPKTTDDPSPSLVALMPYEKTYNSSALSQSSAAFGGSAVFQVFSLGVNAQKQDQIFYLFRDSDTLAMERMQHPPDAPAHSITFGWQFRPVLGRRSVSPGVRQMFAVIALPEIDQGKNMHSLNVRVRTFWRKYDRNLLTTSKVEDYVRGPYLFPAVDVSTSESYERELAPEFTDFQWVTTGANTAVVSFTGKNFFPGTQIQVGDKTHSDPSTGLLIKSDISMELTTSLQDLAAGEAFISGRYGKGVTAPTDKNCKAKGIAIKSIHLADLLGQAEQRLDIVLQDPKEPDLDLNGCSGMRPLVKFGDTLLPEPYGQQVPCDKPSGPKCYQLSTFLKSSLVTGNDLVAVRYPFRGPQWSQALVFTPRSAVAVRYSTDKVDTKAGPKAKAVTLTTLRITGQPFTEKEDWVVVLDRDYHVGTSALRLQDGALLFTVNEDTLGRYKQLLLLLPPPNKDEPRPPAIGVNIPPAVAASAKPTLDATQAPGPVTQGSAPSVTIAGKLLSAIKRVTFEDENLPFQVSSDGTSMTVILSREVTRKPGNAALILRPASGDFLFVTITVNP